MPNNPASRGAHFSVQRRTSVHRKRLTRGTRRDRQPIQPARDSSLYNPRSAQIPDYPEPSDHTIPAAKTGPSGRAGGWPPVRWSLSTTGVHDRPPVGAGSARERDCPSRRKRANRTTPACIHDGAFPLPTPRHPHVEETSVPPWRCPESGPSIQRPYQQTFCPEADTKPAVSSRAGARSQTTKHRPDRCGATVFVTQSCSQSALPIPILSSRGARFSVLPPASAGGRRVGTRRGKFSRKPEGRPWAEAHGGTLKRAPRAQRHA